MDLSTSTVPSFAPSDLSSLPPDTTTPNGAVPISESEAAQINAANGVIPEGAQPISKEEAAAIQRENAGIPKNSVPISENEAKTIAAGRWNEDWVGTMTRNQLVEAAKAAESRDEDVTPYRLAWRKRSDSLDILDSNHPTHEAKGPGPRKADLGTGVVSDILGGMSTGAQALLPDMVTELGQSITEGILTTLNEAGKVVTGKDLMASRLSTEAELKRGKDGVAAGQVFSAPDAESRTQAAANIAAVAGTKPLESLNLIWTFSNRLANKAFRDGSLAPGQPDPGMIPTYDAQFDHALTVSKTLDEMKREVGSVKTDPDIVAAQEGNLLLDPVSYIPMEAAFSVTRTPSVAARIFRPTGLETFEKVSVGGTERFSAGVSAEEAALRAEATKHAVKLETKLARLKKAEAPIADISKAEKDFADFNATYEKKLADVRAAQTSTPLVRTIDDAGMGEGPGTGLNRAQANSIQGNEQLAAYLTRKGALLPVRVAAKVAKTVVENPVLTALTAGGFSYAAGGDPITTAFTALIGANAGRYGLLRNSRNLTKLEAGLAGKIPLGPKANFAMSVAKVGGAKAITAAAGLLPMVPFAFGSGGEEEFKQTLAGGIIIGGMAETVGHLANGLSVSRNLWKEHANAPDTRMDVKHYGLSPTIDAAHQRVVSNLDNSGNNFVQSLRNYLTKSGKSELYTLYSSDYLKALDQLVADGHMDAETAAQAKTQQGLTLPAFTDAAGNVRNIAISRVNGSTPGLSVGHEAGHLISRLLSPEELKHAFLQIRKTYGDDGIEDYRRKHSFWANFNAEPGAPKQVFTSDSILHEIFAENASAVLNAIPIEGFSNPDMKTSEFSRTTYSLVGRALEKLGARAPQLQVFDGSVATGLGMRPSAELGTIIENVLQAHAFDAEKLSTATAGEGAKPTPAPAPKPAARPDQGVLTPADVARLEGRPVTTTTVTLEPRTDGILSPIVHTTTTTVAPDAAPATATVGENVHAVTPEQVQQFATRNTPIIANILSTPRGDPARTVQIPYASATPTAEGGANQVVREAVRRHADANEAAAKAAGVLNPLRALFDKITTLRDWVANSDNKLVHATSLHKVAANVTQLQGMAALHPEMGTVLDMDYLSGPQIAKDIPAYLRNQSAGRSGDGSLLNRLPDEKGGAPLDLDYTPTVLSASARDHINLLMGMEQPQTMTGAQERNVAFAKANQKQMGAVGEVVDVNPLRAKLRNLMNQKLGYDATSVLHSATEVLRVDRIMGDITPRPDIAFPAGDTAAMRAGYMPSTEGVRRQTETPKVLRVLQLHGEKLDHSVPEKKLSLVHYGDAGLKEINAKQFGRSGLTPGSELAGVNRHYWYEQGQENKVDPVRLRGTKYAAEVSGHRIYDGDADPLNWTQGINREKSDRMLMDAGYAGVRRTAGTGKKAYSQVELFEPVKPDKSAPGNTTSFMPATESDKATVAKPDDMGMVSPLERILRATPEKSNREQVNAALRVAKAEEMRDVKDPAGQSFEEYVKQHPEASRQDLLDFATQHHVVIGETKLGEKVGVKMVENPTETEHAGEKIFDVIDPLNGLVRFTGDLESAREIADGLSEVRKPETEYDEHVLPGGRKYRETVFTLPGEPNYSARRWSDGRWSVYVRDGNRLTPVFKNQYFSTEEQALGSVGRSVNSPPNPADYRSPHFRKIPSYLAHARHNERATSGIAEEAARIRQRIFELGKYKSVDSLASGSAEAAVSRGHISADEAKLVSQVEGWRNIYNDTIEPTVPSNVLHIEEIQSDLHQEGRRHGYKNNSGQAEATALIKEYPIEEERKKTAEAFVAGGEQGNPSLFQKNRQIAAEAGRRLDEITARIRELKEAAGAVPDAPFKKTWHELVFKQMLRKAAESGKDWLTWTTGEQQAERYDLSKHVEHIVLQKGSGDKNYLAAYDHSGRRVVDKMVEPKELAEYVGKDAAQKLEAQEWKPYTTENHSGLAVTQDSKILRGLDLKVGGEGMKGFYDEIIPRFADKYLKKYGVSTEDVSVEPSSLPSALRTDPLVVHGVKITPEMRKDILEKGQPLYMPETAVKLDDFKADTLGDALQRPGWAIVTGTQDKLGAHSTPENVANNAKLRQTLSDRGIPFREVGGKFEGIDQGPNFLIQADEATAHALGNEFLQDSVLTSRGFVHSDEAITPSVHQNTIIGPEATKQPYYSILDDGTPFAMGLDHDGKLPPDEAALKKVDESVDNITTGKNRADLSNVKVDTNGLFMPEKPTTTVLTKETAAKFMPARPTVKLEDYANRQIVVLPADRMGSGTLFVGPTGHLRELSIPGQGGRDYMHLGGGWAFADVSAANRFLARMRQVKTPEGNPLAAITVLAPDNHLKNKVGQRAFYETLRAAVDAGAVSKRDADAHVAAMFKNAAASKDANMTDAAREKFESVTNLASLGKLLDKDGLNFNEAGFIVGQAKNKRHPISEKDALALGIHPSDIARRLADPELVGIPFGSVVALMEVDPNQAPVTDYEHKAYPVSVRATPVGFLGSFHNVADLSSERRIFNGGRLQAQPLQTVLPLLDKVSVGTQTPGILANLKLRAAAKAAALSAATVP